ncbi:MAG: histone deacetylase [Desulfovibrio sp.]
MNRSKNSLGIIFFPAYDWSISPTHPEREERLLYTQDQLREEGLFDIEGISEYKPVIADREDIERTHFLFPDPDAVTTRSHLISAGGAIKAAQLVMEKKKDKAFALVRPPGHHAMKVVHGSRGFCNINMEAIMVEHLREKYGVRRIAIVDTDCHHGDGTEDIYWHDPDVLFISLHQDGRTLFPGTGFPHECGGPNARGRNVNIPLPPGTSDEGFLMVMERIVRPILDDFQPELVINSAGQDNHFTDPITNMNLSAQGYAEMSTMLNPDLAVLEGGYAIQGALPYVNLGIALAMAGEDFSNVSEPGHDRIDFRQKPNITEYLDKLCDELPNIYFNPPEIDKDSQDMRVGMYVGETFVRHKQIYYDTDGITEAQVEELHMCENCRGVLKYETRATKRPLSLGVDIPIDACESCRNLGLKLADEAQLRGGYRFVQLINRRDKEYPRYGF